MQDYASNSNKNRDKAAPAADTPRPHVEKLVVGEVTVPKKTISQKFVETFFDGEFYKGMMRHLYKEKLVPNAKNIFFDLGMEALKLGVYRNGDASRLFDPRNIISRMSYQTPVNRMGGFPPGMAQSSTPVGPVRQQPIELGTGAPRNIMNNDRKVFLVGSHEEARDVLQGMSDIINDVYKIVSLAEVKIMLGLEPSPVDNNWGWFSLGDATITHTREGWLLDLPQPEPL